MAEEHAQGDVLAFGALDVFEIAQPDLDAFGGIGAVNGIGGVGTGFARAINEILRAVFGLFRTEHVNCNSSHARTASVRAFALVAAAAKGKCELLAHQVR